MTATATLVRTAVTVPEEPEFDFEEARRMLPRRIEKMQKNPPEIPAPLPTLYSEVLRLQKMHSLERRAVQVLVGLDIEPYTPESVQAYMDAKLAEALTEDRKSIRIARIARVLGWCFLALLIAGFIRCMMAVSNGPGTVAVAMLITGLVGSVASLATVSLIGEWRWWWVEIERYNGKIPEYVLRKAIQMKNALPEGKLWILAFSSHSLENPLVVCPFLVFQAGSKFFHTEVWDERSFEEQESAKRQQLER